MAKSKKDLLEALQTEWYQKLKDEGFRDIEYTAHQSRPLKSYDSYYFAEFSEDQIAMKSCYFTRAQDLLETHEFESELERTIWALHVGGDTLRSITDQVGRKCPDYVFRVVRRLARLIK